MKAYEALLILDQSLKKEDLDALIQEVEADIAKNQGKIEEVQRMGRRRLEHPIGKHAEGYYILINFHAETQAIKKLTAKFRLKETILRFFFLSREDGFVKIKSFDENAPYSDNYSNFSHGSSGGYSQDAAPRQGGY